MLAVDYCEFENNLEAYCDQAIDDYEKVFVTRDGNKCVVMMSQEEYNSLLEKVKEI